MPTTSPSRSRPVRSRRAAIIVDAPPPFSVRSFTVAEYHRLIDAGILKAGDPYELLDGWIVPKIPKNPPHEVCIELMQTLFFRLLPAGWRLRVQSAITLSTSEPEPDGAVCRGSPRDNLAHHPGPSEIALVIEVADSTLSRDHRKAKIYARDKIARYWLINLVDGVIEDHSSPVGSGDAARYKTVKRIPAGGRLVFKLAGKTLDIAADELLP